MIDLDLDSLTRSERTLLFGWMYTIGFDLATIGNPLQILLSNKGKDRL